MRHGDFVVLHADLTVKNFTPVELSYQFVTTPLGRMIIGGDTNGLRLCDFVDDPVEYTSLYQEYHPELLLCQRDCDLFRSVRSFLLKPFTFNGQIPVIVKATEFQLAVWKSVLNIPWGDTSTYASIASDAGRPSAVRAAGTAIGKNPVLFIIPCHRVILSNGRCGKYLRGSMKKEAILKYELGHTG